MSHRLLEKLIMHKIAILVKTYIGDIEYVSRLVESCKKHNLDHIPVYIVAPQTDLSHFLKFAGAEIEVLSDESITTELVTSEVRGIRSGYINQEIIKLTFWQKRLCENYICVDSDGVFIRNFFISDFMYDQTTPYTILVEDNELAVEPEYYKEHWKDRYEVLRHIQNQVGLKGSRILTSHGFSILSAKVLESFKTNYLDAKKKSYFDILEEAPYEFSWYNLWLQYDKTIDIHIREPLFKTFHHKNQHAEYLLRGIKTSDIARGYIGLVVNSNFSRDFGVVSFDDDRHKILAKYFTTEELLTVLFYKFIGKLKSIKERIWRKLK